jgi:Mor family transcriptional regulator
MAFNTTDNYRERRTGPDYKLTPAQEAELAVDYHAGMKLKEIAAKYRIAKPTIYTILNRQAETESAQKADTGKRVGE